MRSPLPVLVGVLCGAMCVALAACGSQLDPDAVAQVNGTTSGDVGGTTADGGDGSGDLATAQQLHYRLHDLNKAIFYDTNPIPIKYMAKRLGILERNEHRLPMVPATPELEKRLDGVLARSGLLTSEAAE